MGAEVRRRAGPRRGAAPGILGRVAEHVLGRIAQETAAVGDAPGLAAGVTRGAAGRRRGGGARGGHCGDGASKVEGCAGDAPRPGHVRVPGMLALDALERHDQGLDGTLALARSLSFTLSPSLCI